MVEVEGTRVIGVISDTHGRLDDMVLDVFAGVEVILHAGDIGHVRIVDRLRSVAPVIAVAGNVDVDLPAAAFPAEVLTDVAGQRVLTGHILDRLLARHAPALEAIAMVVSGHSHRALIDRKDGVLYLNPGSAGSPRFGLPRSVALVEVRDGALEPRIVPLD